MSDEFVLVYIGIVVFFTVISAVVFFIVKRWDDKALKDRLDVEQGFTDLLIKYDELVREVSNRARTAEKEVEDLKDELRILKDTDLNRRVEELEDDNEELSDDLETAKKRYDALREEFDTLDAESSECRRTHKTLTAALDDTRREMEALRHDHAVQTDALDFVRAILTAPVTGSDAVRALYSAVADIVRFVGEEVRPTLAATGELTAAENDRFFGNGLAAWAQTRCKIWLQGKTSVAFIGEYSAGKTSIVNRIIGRDDPAAPLLPVSTRPTTAVPTYLTGGSEARYEFVTPDNELKALSPEIFRRVDKSVLEKVKGVSSLIKYFVISLDNSSLEGLSILDTPGFNSADDDDSARTLAVVNECDALFWVVDVNAGDLNRSSLKVIREHLTKPLYIIVNQIDTKSAEEVAAVESRVAQTLAAENVACAGILRFSTKEPLEPLMEVIGAIGRDASREGYADGLAALLDERVERCQTETKAAETKCFYLENKSSGLSDAYNEALRALRRDCEALMDMPRFSNSLFGKGDYRISSEKYTTFRDLLDKIGERHGERLHREYDEQIATTTEMLMAWKSYADLNFRLRRLRECRDTLIHKTLKLNS